MADNKQNGLNLVDTRSFHVFLEKQAEFLKKYRQIDTDYHAAVEELLADWEGKGADAFRADVRQVEKKLLSLLDVMETVTSVLVDPEDAFDTTDQASAHANQNAAQE